MTITNTSIQRSIVLTEYIPLQLRAEKACDTIDYCSFRKDDTSLLELVFDQTDHIIYRVTLVICADYRQATEEYQLPAAYVEGDLLVDAPAEIDVSSFSCEIYQNAVKIIVSDMPVSKTVLSGNIVWELSEQGNLVSVCLVDPTGKASEHCSKELSSNS